jgi:hypothetical protein
MWRPDLPEEPGGSTFHAAGRIGRAVDAAEGDGDVDSATASLTLDGVT